MKQEKSGELAEKKEKIVKFRSEFIKLVILWSNFVDSYGITTVDITVQNQLHKKSYTKITLPKGLGFS